MTGTAAAIMDAATTADGGHWRFPGPGSDAGAFFDNHLITITLPKSWKNRG